MITKIPVSQLRVGMHIQKFAGSWIDHPFWRSNFMLDSEDELARIVEGGVKEVWVDGALSQGPAAQAAKPRPQVTQLPLPATAAEGRRLADQPAAMAEAASLYRRSIPRIEALFGEARLGNAIDTEGCHALVEEISDSVLRNPGALISVVRLKQRDAYTYMHSVAVCALMLALGRQLGLQGTALRAAGLAGMLHDMGKALVPLEVLNKPGKLSDAEFDAMKRHPELGHRMLIEGGCDVPEALEVCLHHHEKIDGSGYPHGLAGDRIGLYAKMGAICDVYDAVTSVRPYKTAWSPGEAIRSMAQWSSHFDAGIFKAFVKTIGIYPVGSLVRLKSGRLGVVVEQGAKSLLSPVVKVFFGIRSNQYIEPQLVDLSAPYCRDRVESCESPAEWRLKDMDRLWAGDAGFAG